VEGFIKICVENTSLTLNKKCGALYMKTYVQFILLTMTYDNTRVLVSMATLAVLCNNSGTCIPQGCKGKCMSCCHSKMRMRIGSCDL
jgi:hypothetical protein